MVLVSPGAETLPGPFRGPYADGPPPDALVVEVPPLERLRLGDLWRFLVVAWVISTCVTRAVARWAFLHCRGGPVKAACDGLVDGFIRLGPTTIKGGQLIASSGALFPAVLADAARRCLDAVPPFPVEHVRAAIAGDLGHRVEELFTAFDPVPLSAASIGQVHACTLADGRDAVVKVQRPGIRAQMATDLRIGFALAWVVEKSPWGRHTNAREIVRDLHAMTFMELNPAREAWQQHRFRENIGAFGDNEGITAPQVFWDYCGPRVICMERVYGVPMDDFASMEALGIDGQAILRQGAKVWAEAVMIHGPFHGDMHAGNMWVLRDGRGCYLDFGIMGELAEDWRQVLKDLFYTCSFDLDFVRVARAYRRVGAIPPDVGTDEELGKLLNAMLGPILADGFGSLDIAQLVNQSLEILKSYRALAPKELVLVAKQLLYVDKYTRYLAPDYSLTADPFIVKNVFPAEAAAKAAELGIGLEAPAAIRPRAAEGSAGASGPVAERGPTNQGDLMQYAFLTPEWIECVQAIGEEYRHHVEELALPEATVNLVVTDVPFGEGKVLAHVRSRGGAVDVELGHSTAAVLSIGVDYDTARTLVVDQDPMAAAKAFMTGRIRIDGDLSRALGGDVEPMALVELLQAFNPSGPTALGDIDPRAAEVGERIRAVTA